MKRTVIATLALAALFTLTAVAQKAGTPEAQLGAIINQAEVEGEFDDAIPNYKKFLANNGKNRSLAAKAQYHLGVAYEKLGNAEARKAYEQVVRDYPNEPVATDAKRRLAGLADSSLPRLLAARPVCADACDSGSTSLRPSGRRPLSADGRFMAFLIREPGGKSLIGIRDMVTGQVTPLSATQGAEPISLSPNGRRLVYKYRTKDAQLLVISTEADANPKTLVANSELYFVQGTWAPDGKSVLLTAEKPDHTWQLVWVSVTDGTVNELKSLQWRLGPGARPAISPDGKYVAYAALPINPGKPLVTEEPKSIDQHIYVLAADGSAPEVEVVKGANINESPVWMPDGRSLLFVSNRTNNFGLWSVALQNGKAAADPVLVKRDIGRITPIQMTQSGSYYYEMPDRSVVSLRVDALNSGNLQFTSGSRKTIIGENPKWSPDGKHIAFYRSTKPSAAAFYSVLDMLSMPDTLFVYSTETGDENRYDIPLTGKLRLGQKLWFHDGKAILQATYDDDKTALYRIDLKSGEVRQLASTLKDYYSAVSLSPDDKTIYAITPGDLPAAGGSRTDRIIAIDVSSGEETRGFTLPQPGNPLFSPDGRTLYFRLCDKKCDRIVAVDLVTGQQRQVLKVEDPEQISGLTLSPDGRTLASVIGDAVWQPGRPPITGQLFRIGVDGSEYHKLGFQFSTSNSPTLSWTADGAAVLVLEQRNGVQSLTRVPASGGNPAVLQSSVPRAFALSPDGSRIAIESTEIINEGVWALDNVSAFLKTAR